MGDIKSALEIAQEKIDKLGQPTAAERLEWKYLPEGEKLAARYLKEEIDLAAELHKFDKEAQPYVVRGATEILSRNIALPHNDFAKKTNKRAMDGIKAAKTDKVATENAFSKIRRVFQHYVTQGEQQRKDAYESLKMQFAQKLQEAMRQQYGTTTGMRVDVERQPQFQEERRKLQAQLETPYTKLLDDFRRELATIP